MVSLRPGLRVWTNAQPWPVFLAKPIAKAGKKFWVYAQECRRKKNVTTHKMAVNTGYLSFFANILSDGITMPARMAEQTYRSH
jgi:hypothetical protein